MGAAAPFARVARDRVRALRTSKPAVDEKPRELKRWAPVGQQPVERSEANS